MSYIDGFVLFDSINDIRIEGAFSGSIITKLKTEYDYIIFSDSVEISKENGLFFKNGLKIGFETRNNIYSAFSQKITNLL